MFMEGASFWGSRMRCALEAPKKSRVDTYKQVGSGEDMGTQRPQAEGDGAFDVVVESGAPRLLIAYKLKAIHGCLMTP